MIYIAVVPTGEYIVASSGPFSPFGDSFDYVYYVSRTKVS